MLSKVHLTTKNIPFYYLFSNSWLDIHKPMITHTHLVSDYQVLFLHKVFFNLLKCPLRIFHSLKAHFFGWEITCYFLQPGVKVYLKPPGFEPQTLTSSHADSFFNKFYSKTFHNSQITPSLHHIYIPLETWP